MKPIVSVIIPAYNAAATLQRSVDSVLSQDVDKMEILVVDDGSTDDTPKVATQPALRLFSQSNRGPAAARNRGIAESRADLVAFLDADDTWPAGALRHQLAMMQRDESVDVLLGHTDHAPLAGGTPGRFLTFLIGAALFRRTVFDRVGMFNEELRRGEDVDWFMRAREVPINLRISERTTLTYCHDTRRPDSPAQAGPEVLAAMLKRSLDRRKSVGEATDLPPMDAARPLPRKAREPGSRDG